MMVPSNRWTFMVGDTDVSMDTRHTFLTSARDKMFASETGLNHTTPKFLKSAINEEVCCPPFVWTQTDWGLGRMLDTIAALLNTEMVD